MPMANAPTLGRNRSSVRIATRKPAPGSPSTWSRPARARRRSVSEPIACGASISLRLAAQALARRRATANAVSPRAPGGRVAAREHRVDVGLGRVGDPQLLAAEAGSRRRRRARRAAPAPPGRSRPRARSARTRPPPCRRPRAGSTRSRSSGAPGLEDRVGAEALERERRLGLGAARAPAPRGSGTARSPTRLLASNRRASSPCSASAATSGRLTRPGGPGVGDRLQLLGGQPRGCRSYRSRWSWSRCRSSAAASSCRRGAMHRDAHQLDLGLGIEQLGHAEQAHRRVVAAEVAAPDVAELAQRRPVLGDRRSRTPAARRGRPARRRRRAARSPGCAAATSNCSTIVSPVRCRRAPAPTWPAEVDGVAGARPRARTRPGSGERRAG